MRTWVKIIIITAIIIGVDLFVSTYLSNEHDFYEKNLTELALLVENEESAEAQKIVDEIYIHWAKSHHLWETIAEHSEVEQIDILFTKIYRYFPGEHVDETLSDIMELYRLIGFTTGRYKINIVNIL